MTVIVFSCGDTLGNFWELRRAHRISFAMAGGRRMAVLSTGLLCLLAVPCFVTPPLGHDA